MAWSSVSKCGETLKRRRFQRFSLAGLPNDRMDWIGGGPLQCTSVGPEGLATWGPHEKLWPATVDSWTTDGALPADVSLWVCPEVHKHKNECCFEGFPPKVVLPASACE